MKHNIKFSYQYVLFLAIALLLAPATFLGPNARPEKIKPEAKKQQLIAEENGSEVLHGEMWFRY
ncbi:MAG: hypothetical protein JWR18_691 [Segetibacter sp.]|nr:hypothetical protein [Segetibacter sp.]